MKFLDKCGCPGCAAVRAEADAVQQGTAWAQLKEDMDAATKTAGECSFGEVPHPSEKAAATLKDRGAVYGDIKQRMHQVADMWNAILQPRIVAGGFRLQASDVPQLIRLLKEVRLAATPSHYDSLLDLCGYADIQAELTSAMPEMVPVKPNEDEQAQEPRAPAYEYSTKIRADARVSLADMIKAKDANAVEIKTGTAVELLDFEGIWSVIGVMCSPFRADIFVLQPLDRSAYAEFQRHGALRVSLRAIKRTVNLGSAVA